MTRDEYIARIKQIAQEEGANVDSVLKLVRAEGGFDDPYQQSVGTNPATGRREQSFGGLQLNVEGGVGARAIKAGFDPRNNWENAFRFGLRYAKDHGLGEWMGAKKIGLKSLYDGGGGGGGGQYNLKPTLRHVGGAGSRGGYFTVDQPAGSGTTVADTPYSAPPLPEVKDKPKTRGEMIGAGLGQMADAFDPGKFSLQMPQQPGAEWMGGGGSMPSVYRQQMMPTSVGQGVGGMGGNDMRQLLAMLMGGGTMA